MMWRHVLIRSVREASSRGTARLIVFAIDSNGVDCTWSAWPSNAGDRYDGAVHLMLAAATAPEEYAEYLHAVESGSVAEAMALRDRFHDAIRLLPGPVAVELDTHLKGRVFYVDVVQHGAYVRPANQALAVRPSVRDMHPHQPFTPDGRTVDEIIDRYCAYSFDQAFADAQEAILEAPPDFHVGFALLLEMYGGDAQDHA